MAAMRRRVWLGSAILAVTVAATVAAPHALLSPGDLLSGHRDLERSCFSCHAAFRGPDAHCLECHATEDIDAAAAARPSFHSALAEPECSACHTDHRGRGAGHAVREFRHLLLRADLRESCGSCHEAPDDDLHAGAGAECAGCHAAGSWGPANFDHAALFRFDRHHPAECRSCHTETFATFTCYGCHEHRRAKIERKHRKEGIVDFARCAECHRSGDEDEAKRRGRRGGRHRGREHEDD